MAEENVISVIIRAVDNISADLRNIEQRLGGLEKGANKSQQGLDSLTQSSKESAKAMDTLNTAATVLGTTFAPLAKGTFLVQSAFSALAAHKLASILGIVATAIIAAAKSAGDLGAEYFRLQKQTGFTAETLSALSIAAKDNDSDLRSLVTGLRFFQRNLAQAAEGIGEARNLFIDMGFSLDNLASSVKNPEEAFLRFARRFATIEDVAVKQRVAMQLFGRGGFEIIQILNDIGTKGIEPFRKKAEEMGLLVSKDMVEKGKAFKDAMTDMGTAVEGFAHRIGTLALPPLNDFLNAINRLLLGIDTRSFRKKMEEIVEFASDMAFQIEKRTKIPFGKILQMRPEELRGLIDDLSRAGNEEAALYVRTFMNYVKVHPLTVDAPTIKTDVKPPPDIGAEAARKLATKFKENLEKQAAAISIDITKAIFGDEARLREQLEGAVEDFQKAFKEAFPTRAPPGLGAFKEGIEDIIAKFRDLVRIQDDLKLAQEDEKKEAQDRAEIERSGVEKTLEAVQKRTEISKIFRDAETVGLNAVLDAQKQELDLLKAQQAVTGDITVPQSAILESVRAIEATERGLLQIKVNQARAALEEVRARDEARGGLEHEVALAEANLAATEKRVALVGADSQRQAIEARRRAIEGIDEISARLNLQIKSQEIISENLRTQIGFALLEGKSYSEIQRLIDKLTESEKERLSIQRERLQNQIREAANAVMLSKVDPAVLRGLEAQLEAIDLQLNNLPVAIRKTIQSMGAMDAIGEAITKSMADSFSSLFDVLIDRTKTFSQKINNVMVKLGESVVRAVFSKIIVEPLLRDMERSIDQLLGRPSTVEKPGLATTLKDVFGGLFGVGAATKPTAEGSPEFQRLLSDIDAQLSKTIGDVGATIDEIAQNVPAASEEALAAIAQGAAGLATPGAILATSATQLTTAGTALSSAGTGLNAVVSAFNAPISGLSAAATALLEAASAIKASLSTVVISPTIAAAGGVPAESAIREENIIDLESSLMGVSGGADQFRSALGAALSEIERLNTGLSELNNAVGGAAQDVLRLLAAASATVGDFKSALEGATISLRESVSLLSSIDIGAPSDGGIILGPREAAIPPVSELVVDEEDFARLKAGLTDLVGAANDLGRAVNGVLVKIDQAGSSLDGFSVGLDIASRDASSSFSNAVTSVNDFSSTLIAAIETIRDSLNSLSALSSGGGLAASVAAPDFTGLVEQMQSSIDAVDLGGISEGMRNAIEAELASIDFDPLTMDLTDAIDSGIGNISLVDDLADQLEDLSDALTSSIDDRLSTVLSGINGEDKTVLSGGAGELGQGLGGLTGLLGGIGRMTGGGGILSIIQGVLGTLGGFLRLMSSLPQMLSGIMSIFGGIGRGISSLFGWIGGLFGEKGGVVPSGLERRSFAIGGRVPKEPKKLSSAIGGEVPIIAHEGEFVVQRSAVEKMGVDTMREINRTGKLPDKTSDSAVTSQTKTPTSPLVDQSKTNAMRQPMTDKVDRSSVGSIGRRNDRTSATSIDRLDSEVEIDTRLNRRMAVDLTSVDEQENGNVPVSRERTVILGGRHEAVDLVDGIQRVAKPEETAKNHQEEVVSIGLKKKRSLATGGEVSTTVRKEEFTAQQSIENMGRGAISKINRTEKLPDRSSSPTATKSKGTSAHLSARQLDVITARRSPADKQADIGIADTVRHVGKSLENTGDSQIEVGSVADFQRIGNRVQRPIERAVSTAFNSVDLSSLHSDLAKSIEMAFDEASVSLSAGQSDALTGPAQKTVSRVLGDLTGLFGGAKQDMAVPEGVIAKFRNVSVGQGGADVTRMREEIAELRAAKPAADRSKAEDIQQQIFLVDQRPPRLGPRDVVLLVSDDMARGGQTAKGVHNVLRRGGG